MDAQLLMRSLVDLRKDRGIFQKDLARQLGIQPASLSAMENGSYTPSVKQIDQYAAVFGFEVGLKRQEGLEYQNDPLSDKTIYSLRLFDKELLQFSMQKDSPGHLEISLLSVNRETVHLLPPGLELSPDGLMKWLSQRTIPKNRAFVNEILYSLNLQPGDLKGIIDVCMGLSLNDSYWIVPEDFSGTFSQYNLYENRFSEALSLVAYTGYADRVHLFTTSPELTTDGALPKAWKFIPGQGILLFKQGTWGASNAGREPYCEYLASQIGEAMGLFIVDYDLQNWKGKTASVCALFTGVDISYVPIGVLVPDGGIDAVAAYCRALGEEYLQFFASMLVFDALIYNEDRHFGNFGLLFDAATAQPVGPAPLFDHGMSLLHFVSKDNMKNYRLFSDYARTRSNPYGVPYLDLVRQVMGPVQKAQLRKLIGFKFKREEGHLNFSERHLRLLERLIRNRVQELLKIPNADFWYGL